MTVAKKQNQLLLSQIELLRNWASSSTRNEHKINLGFADETRVRQLKIKLGLMKTKVGDDWEVFIKELGQNMIVSDAGVMKKYIRNAICNTNESIPFSVHEQVKV